MSLTLSPRLSVLLPAYREPHTLPEILRGFAAQTLPPSEFEVVIVVDGASPAIEDFLRTASPPFELRWFVRGHEGAARARDFALEQARGELIVSLDDDMVPAPEFLQRHAAGHGPRTRNVLIGGILEHPESPQPFLARAIGWTREFQERISVPGYAPTACDLPSGNFSLFRQHLIESGGWEGGAGDCGAFDPGLGHRLLQHGLALRADPAALAYHRSVKPLGEALLHARALGQAQAFYSGNHPERLDDLALPRFIVGSRWMRATLRLARLTPGWCFSAFARAVAPLLFTARWRVNRLMAALARRLWALYLCRGFWDVPGSCREAIRLLRSRNRTGERFRSYWQGRTQPEHLEDNESYRAAYGREIAGLASEKAGGWVLEIGCGDGSLFPYLGFSPARYRGVDFSASMLGLFASRHPGTDLVLAEGSGYLDAERKYDVILSSGVVQYFDEAMLTCHLQNARQMLAPGGRLVLANVPERRLRLRWVLGSVGIKGSPSATGGRMDRLRRLSGLGNWYSREQLAKLAGENSYQIEFAESASFPGFVHAVLTPGAAALRAGS